MSGVVDQLVPDWLDVSRETLDRLAALNAMIKKWTPVINLVSQRSVAQSWQRHILDSAQILALAPQTARNWADLGSGAGLPGLVVAVLALEKAADLHITLVESNQRKASFLMQAIRDLGLPARVLRDRIESVPPLLADVISARALAPLTTLCGYAYRHMAPGGAALFMKGAKFGDEVAECSRAWQMDLVIHHSKTDPAAVILEIRRLKHG